MTVYNGERYVGLTVESILSQTFTDFEFLVIDDGSNDGTYEILAGFAAREPRMTLLRNEHNINITRSMNHLFSLAQGMFVTRHDGDDISMPERFARQVEFLETHPEIGLVATQVQVIDDIGTPLTLQMFNGPPDNESIQQALVHENCLCQGSVMFRREILEVVGYYDEEVDHSEDYDLWLRMVENTQVTRLVEKLYWYRKHPKSISQVHHGATVSRAAVALERAYFRRLSSKTYVPDRVRIANEYARSINSCAAAGAFERVEESIAGVLKFCPEIIFSDTFGIPIKPTVVGLQMIEKIFSKLPLTAQTKRLKARFLGRIYIREVFDGLVALDWASIDHYLWIGLQYDPTWLVNRGIISIAARSMVRHIRSRLKSW